MPPADAGAAHPGRSYLDHASTSPLRPEARAAMADAVDGGPLGDPGRLHAEGRRARVLLEDARERVAAFLGTRPRQVVLTSGATEAVNAAVWGATRSRPGAPVVLADVEHSSVRLASERLAPLQRVAVTDVGRVEPAAVDDVLARLATEGAPPAVVHCQLANHEVGTVQPVAAVAEVCRRHGALLHVDAAAGVGHLPVVADELGADLLSVSGHKLGAPTGTGCLVLRRGLRIEPLLVGGEQERARRAGMEPVVAAVGLGAVAGALADPDRLAAELAVQRRLGDRLREAAAAVEGMALVGDPDPDGRLPHLVCVVVAGVEAEPVLLALDQAGVAAHSGSSCASESLLPSPVLAAMGVDGERSLRLSVGWSSTDADVDAAVAALGPAVERLRALRG